MNQNKKQSPEDNQIDLTPASKSLMRIYAVFAILLVVIPEWIAELTISLRNSHSEKQLPKASSAWEEMPELKVSTMTFKELRLLAQKLKIHGYARNRKNILSSRILKRLNREISTKVIRRLFS